MLHNSVGAVFTGSVRLSIHFLSRLNTGDYNKICPSWTVKITVITVMMHFVPKLKMTIL